MARSTGSWFIDYGKAMMPGVPYSARVQDYMMVASDNLAREIIHIYPVVPQDKDTPNAP